MLACYVVCIVTYVSKAYFAFIFRVNIPIIILLGLFGSEDHGNTFSQKVGNLLAVGTA
jgi:hypothetical protein